MEIILANPRGFCAGVDRAITIVERALELFGAPIYVRHEVVHNKYVVEDLLARGAVFVETLDEVPDGATLIFSAHGVSAALQQEAKQRGFRVFDATCPLVTKVHMEVARYSREGYECILIGHAKHPEVEGTLGQYDNEAAGIYLIESVEDISKLVVKNPERLAYVSQTTLSVDECAHIISVLRQRFPHIMGPKRDDICYATQNRQDAVKDLAAVSDVILVVGSVTSSNSNRLKELSIKLGVPAYLIDSVEEVDPRWLLDKQRIGVTAGASAPEILVQNLITHLKSWGATSVRMLTGTEENMVFAVPKELRVE